MENKNTNGITLHGYSERGVMNALFYGIAYKGTTEDIREFLCLAGIKKVEEYTDFEIIMEGSLSDFGDSDAIIIAKRNNEKNGKTVFFIEAKVSNGDNKNTLEKRYKDFCNNFNSNKREGGYSSNLFYQLCLKHYLFKLTRIIKDNSDLNEYKDKNLEDLIKLADYVDYKGYITRKGSNKRRKFGKNPVVHKFINDIKNCSDAKYIAIVPDPNENIDKSIKDYIREKNIDILSQSDIIDNLHFVTWHQIKDEWLKNEELNKNIQMAIEYNQNLILINKSNTNAPTHNGAT